uniref:Peptidase S1 domain-containing protein n=1 Tax=Anopheles dirus TaxID=7168 RepID=A0A3F2YW26_9DIPT
MRFLIGAILCLSVGILVRTVSGCSCVPERRCPAADVDLRLVDADNVCPVGMVCCDVPVHGDTPTPDDDGGAFCSGECVQDAAQCTGESGDYEYGLDLIDIRLVGGGNGCPDGQHCCKTGSPIESKPRTCGGTCLPQSLCTMFEPGEIGRGGGCTEGHVCCRMNRTSWMGLIGDINAMMVGPEHDGGDRSCAWTLEQDGTRVPPWLVSIWARVELIPGLQADQFVCGGVLVDPTLVLTTASCVVDQPTDELFVNVGDHDLSSRSLLRTENIHTVREKIVHEYYSTSGGLHNDVALLRLAGTVPSGHCAARLDATPPDAGNGAARRCYYVGWDRELLATTSGRPHRHPAEVTNFQEDLFCAPGTICLQRNGDDDCCDGDSLRGSAVVCEDSERQDDATLRGLLVRNCAGVGMESIAAWLDHQRAPGFVQMPHPTDPSRLYLPVQ